MTINDFIKQLRNIPHEFVDGALVVGNGYAGNVYLGNLTALPDTHPVTFNNDGGVYLGSITALPDTHPVTFNNDGGVDLRSITALPDTYPVSFNNAGAVDLGSITALPDTHPVTFNNAGAVDLGSITALPDTHPVTFNNDGGVYLGSITALPDTHPVTFNNDGGVDLRSITALPDTHPVTFNNAGAVYLGSITDQKQRYGKGYIDLRYIDNFTMLMGRSRMIGDVRMHRARYFAGGPIDKLKACFIAEKDKLFAHGETLNQAIGDLRYKIAQVDFDASDIINKIKETQVVKHEQFRLITGACSGGLSHGMQQAGLDANADSLPLDVVLAACHGSYGNEFKSYFQ